MLLRKDLQNSKLCLPSEVKRWRHREKEGLNFTCFSKIERIKHKLIPIFKQLETYHLICIPIFLTPNIYSNTNSRLADSTPLSLSNIEGQAVNPHTWWLPQPGKSSPTSFLFFSIQAPQNNANYLSKMWISICWHPCLKYLCLLSFEWSPNPLPWPFLIRPMVSSSIFSYYSLNYLQPNRNAFILSDRADHFFS